MLTLTLHRAAGATNSLSRARPLFATIFAALFVLLLAACGGNDYQVAVQAAPTISGFAGTPAAVPVGGGQVLLSWSALNATTLTLDNGVGDVSGLSSKVVNVTANTTFTLTAGNATGTTTATTAVSVATLPAPAITAFTATPASLPIGGGAVTLSWATTDAASLTIDNGVGGVTGTSKVVNVTANTTFTLSATNATGTASRTTAVSIAAGAVRYIDAAAGADANPCTQAAPCKSLTKALVGAPAGATFLLADGVYTPVTEGANGLNIPDGATLQAAHPGAATLATLAVQVLGSATFNGLVIDRQGPTFGCGGIEAGSATGTPTLTLIGVFSNCTNWLHLASKVKATMTPGALPGGIYTTGLPANGGGWASVSSTVATGGSAELLIQGGVIEGSNSGIVSGTVLSVGGNARLTLDGVTVRNWKPAALGAAGGTVILRNGTLIDHAGSDPTTPAARCGAVVIGGYYLGTQATVLTMDHSTIANSPGNAICLQNNLLGGVFDQLTLTQSTITASGVAAIASEFSQGFGATITLDGMSLTNNGYGIYWAGRTGGSFDVRNTTVTGSTSTGIGAGIFMYATQTASFKMRGSAVSGGAQDGATFGGFVTMTVDLGTSADPGGNTFTGNALSGLLNGMAPGQTLNAVGNTWTPNAQGADANGRYSTPPTFTTVPKVGPASGVNYRTENASTLNL